MKKLSSKKGFTIVELVIVIAVIAILTAVLIPTFSSVIHNANASAAMQEIKAAYVEAYSNVLNDNHGSLPSDDYDNDTKKPAANAGETIGTWKFVFDEDGLYSVSSTNDDYGKKPEGTATTSGDYVLTCKKDGTIEVKYDKDKGTLFNGNSVVVSDVKGEN